MKKRKERKRGNSVAQRFLSIGEAVENTLPGTLTRYPYVNVEDFDFINFSGCLSTLY